MNPTAWRWRTVKKTLAWAFWLVNIGVIVGVWSVMGLPEVLSGDLVVMLRAVARLCGLMATFCALTQFVLMGRTGWLEPIFGLDRLAVFHRRNGVATLSFILAHASLMVFTHPLLQGSTDFLGIFLVPYVWMAAVAVLLFITTVGLSIYIVRKHVTFETWYTVHLLNYAAIALVPWHQLTNGTDFLVHPLFAWYWIGLYSFTVLNLLLWRFAKVFWGFARHRFTVARVHKETPTATSVYITGKHMQKFHAKGGQFVLVRFLTKELWPQEHPFSLSRLPGSQGLRLTIRQLGDFTNAIPQLKPGTPVVVSGPFGAFTHEQRRTNKLLYIAGGIGITPIRAMLEEQANRGDKDNAIMLYGNRTQADTVLWDELQELAARLHMPLHNVLSDQKDYTGEQGFVDKQKIARLVPDVAGRDIFLCGPPPMMWGIIAALKELGVPQSQIHYERFALHKG